MLFVLLWLASAFISFYSPLLPLSFHHHIIIIFLTSSPVAMCLLLFLPLFFFFSVYCESQQQFINTGEWVLLQPSVGISAMHMQLLRNDAVVALDRTDFGHSNLSLPIGRCRRDPNDTALIFDCTAHSLLYHLSSNSFTPLFITTDTWCSSGSVLPDGTLLHTGGYNDGDHVVRTLSPDPRADWVEHPSYLSVRRWYATNQILPDGRVIIVGGRRQFNYEFYPKGSDGPRPLRFLQETRDPEENNLYPFLHLLPNGNLFIFANTRAIEFDYTKEQVMREFPPIPGQQPRNNPSTGSSVLLPLRLDTATTATNVEAEVLVCGGAPRGSFYQANTNGTFVRALSDCLRIRVTDPNPTWTVEEMPMPRVMGDMLLLPTGDVIIINGAGRGVAGWDMGRDAVLKPVLYRTYEPGPSRFQVLAPSSIPRMYHSAAVVLPDGRVLVGGSNPHKNYNFTTPDYPTDLSMEAFWPPYLSEEFDQVRPQITYVHPNPNPNGYVGYTESLRVGIFVGSYVVEPPDFAVVLLAPSFTTHSLGMNQRLVVLDWGGLLRVDPLTFEAIVMAPPTAAVAPPGWYLLFLLHAGVPSSGAWVRIG